MFILFFNFDFNFLILFEAYSLTVFILFLGFNTVNDIQSGEIRDLLKRGIRDNTTKSYKLHLRE